MAVVRYSVPFGSNARATGSIDPDYRRAEGECIRQALPVLIRATQADVLILGRESIAWHVRHPTQHHAIPSLLMVHGGLTLARLLTGAGEAHALRDRFRRITRIVAVAQHLARSLQALGLHNVTVVGNSIDLDAFAPRPRDAALLHELAIAADQPIALHVSNLRPLKHPLDIVRSARITLRSDPRLVYVIVGDGSSRHEMEQLSRRLGVVQSFRFAGWVDHRRVPDYMNLADVVIMPSETEGQSLVHLETQACGRVILASDIPGAREVIVDGETGLLCPVGDIAGLAAKTLLAVGDPELRVKIGRAARTHATHHGIATMVSAYEAIIGELVGCSTQRSGRLCSDRVDAGSRVPPPQPVGANGG
jgi:glycosyltransferase involved in cell wall biosynthesis